MILHDDDILVIADAAWDDPKRVRHKMPAAWAHEGNRVLWVEKPPFPAEYGGPPGRLRRALRGELRQVGDRLWVGTPPPAVPTQHKGGVLGNAARALHRPFFVRRIRRYLRELDFDVDWLVLFNQAERWDLLRRIPHGRSIYYCNDLFQCGKFTAASEREEQRCCGAVDVVFTTSAFLRDRLRPFNPRTHEVLHAVDTAWWEANKDRVPAEYGEIARPRLVFTGVMTPKMEMGLIEQVAQARPGWQWVFVGPVTAEARGLGIPGAAADLPNVHFVGPRELDELAGFLAGADVLTLPYRLGRQERASGLPLKFYEYFISGRPIVTTPFTEFETQYRELIHVEPRAEDWVARIDALLSDAGGEPDLAERRYRAALENSYAERIERQRGLLAGYFADSLPGKDSA